MAFIHLWARSIHNQITDDDVASAYLVVEQFLIRIESLLTDSDVLFGTEYTLADVEAAPIAVRLKYPRVSAWLSRLQALLNLAPTYAFAGQK